MNTNITRVIKHGKKQKVATIPSGMNLPVGSLIRIVPLEVIDKKTGAVNEN